MADRNADFTEGRSLGSQGACGAADMRKSMTELAMLLQQGLPADPLDGAVCAFRGRLAGLIWHGGVRLCMLTKGQEQGLRLAVNDLERADRVTGRPVADLLDGCGWRAPVPVRRPELAGKDREVCN